MNKVDWFRRSTWTAVDREEFNARLKRSRGAGNKAQYLRIQALHLAEGGNQQGAIELLDRMFAEFPQQMPMAHLQKAECLAKLGHAEEAINEYRAALQSERDFPNVRTNAHLNFGWFVVVRQLTNYYDEISQVLQEFRNETGLRFPDIEYQNSVIQAMLADARGETTGAREFAKQALAEAAKEHSGLRYHPKVGLVGAERRTFEDRLQALARS